MNNQNDLISCHALLIDYLEKIFLFKPFVDGIKQDEFVLNFSINNLELLFWLSKEVNDFKKYKSLKLIFQNLIDENKKENNSDEEKKTVSIVNENKKYLFESIGNLKDEINHIAIWCLNTYELNLKDITQQDVLKSQLDEPSMCNLQSNSEEFKPDLNVYKNIFKVKDFVGFKTNDSEQVYEHNLNDLLVKTQAAEKLHQEIIKGTIYIYTSKPKIIPKIKHILSFMYLIGSIASMALLISISYLFVILGSSQDSSMVESIKRTFTFAVISFIFFIFAIPEVTKNFSNDNYKYFLSRKIFYYLFVASCFIFIWFRFGTDISNIIKPFHFTKGKNFTWFLSECLIFFLLLNLFITSLVYLVTYYFLNPKKNEQLISELLKKYTDKKPKRYKCSRID